MKAVQCYELFGGIALTYQVLSQNKRHICALALLDFSTVFDRIHCCILIHRLNTNFRCNDAVFIIFIILFDISETVYQCATLLFSYRTIMPNYSSIFSSWPYYFNMYVDLNEINMSSN